MAAEKTRERVGIEGKGKNHHGDTEARRHGGKEGREEKKTREGEREREREGVQNDIDASSLTLFTKASSVIVSCTSWRSLARTLTVPSSASLAPTTTT